MANYITIDGGTTNTRIRLVCDGTVTDTLTQKVGARNGIGGNEPLKAAVREGIAALLNRNRFLPDAVDRILASGMITSEFGLVDLPHIPAPAGLAELHRTMYETVLPALSPIPFAFIRGVRTQGEDLAGTDMMRGEETELMGLLQEGTGLYILPGSHSKIIRTDEAGRITDFRTMLTGEMIAALAENTILRDAVELRDHPLIKEDLLQGFQYARQHGINDALFKVRILKNRFHRPEAAIYNFFLGVLLADEIAYILRQEVPLITVAGNAAIKQATALLLQEYSPAQIRVIPNCQADEASARGALRIFKYGK